MSHTKLLSSSSKMQGENLKTSARRFQGDIHFNLGTHNQKHLKMVLLAKIAVLKKI